MLRHNVVTHIMRVMKSRMSAIINSRGKFSVIAGNPQCPNGPREARYRRRLQSGTQITLLDRLVQGVTSALVYIRSQSVFAIGGPLSLIRSRRTRVNHIPVTLAHPRRITSNRCYQLPRLMHRSDRSTRYYAWSRSPIPFRFAAIK